MSQAGEIDVVASSPEIPTQFNTDGGVPSYAIPIANELDLFGTVVAAGTNPFRSIGSGKTVTYELQKSQAVAGVDTTRLGISNFDSASFTVNDGFVTLKGGGLAVDSNSGDDAVVVYPDNVSGDFKWQGVTVANADHVKPVYFKASATANTIDLDVQVATERSGAPADKNDAGLCSFDNVNFTVDSNGFVSSTYTHAFLFGGM